LSIEGTMLSEEAENEMAESEGGVVANRDNAGRRLGGSRALGATNLAIAVEEDLMESKKPRRRY